MRPRKPRRHRPLMDMLEDLAPVSSLIPGLSVGTPAAVVGLAGEGGDRESNADRVGGMVVMARSTAPLNPTTSSQPSGMLRSRLAHGIGGGAASTSTRPDAPTAAPINQPASDSSPFDNVIALVSPAAGPEPARSEGSPLVAPRPAAQPGPGRPAGAPPQATSSHPSTPATTTRGTAPFAFAASTPAPAGGGLTRPMVLAPSQNQPGAATANAPHSSSPNEGLHGGQARFAKGHRIGFGQAITVNDASSSGGPPPGSHTQTGLLGRHGRSRHGFQWRPAL